MNVWVFSLRHPRKKVTTLSLFNAWQSKCDFDGYCEWLGKVLLHHCDYTHTQTHIYTEYTHISIIIIYIIFKNNNMFYVKVYIISSTRTKQNKIK